MKSREFSLVSHQLNKVFLVAREQCFKSGVAELLNTINRLHIAFAVTEVGNVPRMILVADMRIIVDHRYYEWEQWGFTATE